MEVASRRPPPVPVPEGTILLHIGPHKTGTTALQQALYLARDALLEQGVGYPATSPNPISAVASVLERPARTRGGRIPSRRRWTGLVRDVRRSRARRQVLSSEAFADAGAEAISRIVGDLGPDRLRIAITLRPLARILPSQWQQYVQHGVRASYEDWLRVMLDGSPRRLTPTFWRRHRHDRLVERWAAALGPDRVTVVALDDRDRRMVLRTFEQLLDLRQGTLAGPPALVNRSMSLPEIEAVRAFNRAYHRQHLGNALHARVLTFVAAPYLKRRPADPAEPAIETPDWARDRVAEIAGEMVDHIRASGVRVVGDLDAMREVARGNAGAQATAGAERTAATVPAAIAGRLAVGIALASGLGRRPPAPAGHPEWGPTPAAVRAGTGTRVEPAELRVVPTYVLAAVIAMRARAAVARRLPRALARRVSRTPDRPRYRSRDPMDHERRIDHR